MSALTVASEYQPNAIPSGAFLARFAPASRQREWHSKGITNPGAVIQVEANQMVERMIATKRKKDRGWLPEPASLAFSLFHLVAQGLSLAPFRHESALLPFKNKITPVMMRRGLERLAMEHWPIRMFDPNLVLEGDEFEYRGPTTIPMHRAGNKHALVAKALPAFLSGQILEGYATIVQRDSQGDFVAVGHLDRPSFTEKIRANRNAQNPSGDSAWGSHPLEMLKKTLVKYTLTKCLHPQGDFAFAMQLDGYAESHRAQEAISAITEARIAGLLGEGESSQDDADQMAEMTEGAEADGKSAQPQIRREFIEAEVQGG